MDVSLRSLTLADTPTLPLYIWEHIASHLSTREWAEGPALTCKDLSNLQLRRLELQIPVTNGVRPVLEVLEPSAHYSLAEHVKWIAQHWQLCVDLSVSISCTCSTSGCLCQVLYEALNGVWREGVQELAVRQLRINMDGPSSHLGRTAEVALKHMPLLTMVDLLSGSHNSHGGLRHLMSYITQLPSLQHLQHLRLAVLQEANLQVIADIFPSIQTLHLEGIERTETLGFHQDNSALDLSKNSCCRQLSLRNVLPSALTVPPACNVFIEDSLQSVAAWHACMQGCLECVAGVKLHLEVDDFYEWVEPLRALSQVCRAIPNAETLCMHFSAGMVFAYEVQDGHIDMAPIALLPKLTAFKLTFNVSGCTPSDDGNIIACPRLRWTVSIPVSLSLERLSLEVLGADPGLTMQGVCHMGHTLKQMSMLTHGLSADFVTALSQSLAARGLSLDVVHVEDTGTKEGWGELFCHYIGTNGVADLLPLPQYARMHHGACPGHLPINSCE